VLAARETQERVLSDVRTVGLTAFLAVTGFVLTLFALQDLGLGSDPSVVAVLALAAFVAEVFGGRLTGRIEVSASGFLAILAAVICGPAAAAITGLVAATVELRGGPRAKWLAFSGLYAIEGVAAGYAAHSDSSLAARTTIAALALFAVNLAGMSLVVVARRITPLGAQIRITAVADSVGAVLAVPVVMGLAYGYRLAGIGSLLLVLAPVLAAHLLLRLYRETADLSMRLSEGNMTFALSLVRALDARDEHTAGHSAAVAVYARDLANAQGLPVEDVAKIQLAALLHDIGKIGVPTEVLNKQGPLDDDEWSHIRRHPEIGEQIAGEAPFFAEISRFIRHHHERPDGRGYPDGLVGDRIPLASAIIGLADAYNAMTSCRPYRSALAPEEAVDELRRGAGAQFDRHLVDVFVNVLRRHDAAYSLGQGERFSLEGQRTAILAELGERRALIAHPTPAVA
jgi:putative nucleotidyltransferase with HDIG domain